MWSQYLFSAPILINRSYVLCAQESLTRIENLSSDSLQGKGKQTREEEWTGTPSSGFELSEVQLLYRPRLGRIADIFHCDMEAIVRSQGITDVLGSRPYIPDIRTDGKNLAAVSPRSEGSLENLNDLTHSTVPFDAYTEFFLPLGESWNSVQKIQMVSAMYLTAIAINRELCDRV